MQAERCIILKDKFIKLFLLANVYIYSRTWIRTLSERRSRN